MQTIIATDLVIGDDINGESVPVQVSVVKSERAPERAKVFFEFHEDPPQEFSIELSKLLRLIPGTLED